MKFLYNVGCILLFAFMTQNSFAQEKQQVNLKSGDILFCSYQTGDLSAAINKVTQTERKTNYSHMVLVEMAGADTFVIHASLKRGVVKESLQKFLMIDQPALVDIYRIQDSLQFTIDAALQHANKFIGLPYNAHYLMNDTSYYCSQLIYEVFKGHEIFQLEPMTFKNPNSEAFNEGWIKYYKNLGIAIPEGEPGCNPNGMAASGNLNFIQTFKN